MKRTAWVLLFTITLGLSVWLGFRWAGPEPRREAEEGKGYQRQGAVARTAVATGESGAGESGSGETGADKARAAMTAEAKESEANEARAQIHEWLTSSTDTSMVARTMLAGVRTLKPEQQILAFQEMAPLVSDGEYEGLHQLQLEAQTSDDAKRFLFQEALSRSDSVKLPLLLAVMQQPDHPNALEARERLATALGQDFGNDAGAWRAAVAQQLRDN